MANEFTEITEMIETIALVLRGGFPNSAVYADDVVQGLVPRSFHIITVDARYEPYPSGRWLRRAAFDIMYYPSSAAANMEMLGIAEQLFPLLEFISCERSENENLLHGTDMRHEIIDGVLHFFVNYDLMLRRERQEEFMQSLTGHVSTKTPFGSGSGSNAPGAGGGAPASGTGIATGGTDYMQTIDINTNPKEDTDNGN